MGEAKPRVATLAVLGLLIFGSYVNGFAESSAPAQEAEGFRPALWLLKVYREHISPIDGDRCPSIPSCSSYSYQAIQKHGFVIGWLMTIDRLLHEGEEETNVSPLVYSDGRWKIFDPVQNNDFWWYRPGPTKGHFNEPMP
mgnify:CR=1 FL=1